MGAIYFSLDQTLVDFFRKNLDLDTFIETGTFRGDTTNAVKEKFKQIHTIELSQELYDNAKVRFVGEEHIEIHQGDSGKVIREITSSEKFGKNRKTLYWLDAHWCEAIATAGINAQCPLLQEISSISGFNSNSLILIDDARLFLAPPNGHDSYASKDWPRFHEIAKTLMALSSEHEIMVCDDVILFFPVKIRNAVIDFLSSHGTDWLSVADKSRETDSLQKQILAQHLTFLENLRSLLPEKPEATPALIPFRGIGGKIPKKIVSTEILDEPLLSIVVPTFNQGPYIRDCLESIQNQTYQNIQVLIQDSMSDDETERICSEFAKKDLRFIYYREKDLGQTDAINRGLLRSNGQLWTWLCSDDRYHSRSSLENLIKGFVKERRKNSMVLGAYGDAFYMSEDGKVGEKYFSLGRNIFYTDFQNKWPMSQPASILLRKNVYDAGGCETHLNLGMDLDLFIRVLRDGGLFTYVPTPVADIRIQLNSKSVKYRKDTAVTALRIIRKHFGNCGKIHQSSYVRELYFSANDPQSFKDEMRWVDISNYRIFLFIFRVDLVNFWRWAVPTIFIRGKYFLRRFYHYTLGPLVHWFKQRAN